VVSIVVVTPVRPQSSSGNEVTSKRWARLLEAEGYQVTTVQLDEEAPVLSPESNNAMASADLLIALHARRSANAIQWWRDQRSPRPVVVALTGTDLYVDLPDDATTTKSVNSADALIVLQSEAVSRLSKINSTWGDKVLVVHQSVTGPLPVRTSTIDEFRVVVLAHLRPVKDPLLAARAVRRLPLESSVSVHHAGGAMSAELAAAAEIENDQNHRYRWYGELERQRARELLATADVMACTSTSEGGANVVTEAIALGIPIVATRIDGNTGLIGHDHPGLVSVGDDKALSELLLRLERDTEFLAELQTRTYERQHLTDTSTEQSTLSSLVETLVG